jgi:hypothetical protein
MMTQRDVDARDKMEEIVRYGTVIAQHPRDTNDRHWVSGVNFGLWLHPGEFLFEYQDKGYVVGVREA